MTSIHATVPLARPARYSKQLLSHLGRRLATSTAPDGRGVVRSPGAQVELSPVDGALVLRATGADPSDVEHLAGVVARHLVRFVGDDAPEVLWEEDDAVS